MITNLLAPENHRWRKQKSGFVIPTKHCARRTRCPSGRARAGITCDFAMRTTIAGLLVKKPNATGVALASSQCPIGKTLMPRPESSIYRSEEHTSELQSRPHLVCRL